jgi:hypothetical protein
MLDVMRVVILVAALSAVGACKRGDNDAPPPAPKPPSDGIEMVKLGDPPQRLLRYHLAKGATTAMEIVMDYQVAQNDQVMKLPTLVLGTELTVDDVQADGTAATHTKVVKAAIREVEGAATPGVADDQSKRLVGITFAGTLSSGGHVLASHVVGADKIPPELKTSVEQVDRSLRAIAMALPDVPIGVGAQWKHRATVNEAGGIHGVTLTTVDVVAIDQDKVTYITTTSVEGADQTVGSTDIKHVGGSGAGRGTLDLARLALNGEQTMTLQAEMTSNGQTDKMKATTTAKITSPAP